MNKYQRLFKIRCQTIETPWGRKSRWYLHKLSYDTYDYQYVSYFGTWEEARDKADQFARMYEFIGLTAPTMSK